MWVESISYLFLGLTVLLGGSFFSLILSFSGRLSRIAGAVSALAGSIFMLVVGLEAWTNNISLDVSLPWQIPVFGGNLHLDVLAAIFLVLINGVAIPVTIYGYGYSEHYTGYKNVGALWFLYNGFLISMNLVVLADGGFIFMLAWELMSLISYFLVIYEHENKDIRQAGFIYIIMTHIAAVFLFAAFFMLYVQSGDFSFASYKEVMPLLSTRTRNLIFFFAVLGFGTKAGLIPLHIWLPRAHPASPGHMPALKSGAMVKTAIYGMMRLIMDIMAPAQVSWGVTLIILGLISAFLGAAYAVMQKDYKKLLAYSTVENVGIIFIALGLACIFMESNKTLATLALLVVIYHSFNHAAFKSLLFMGAGSVHLSTGTRDMDKLGGLLKQLPVTGTLFIIGAAAAAALPPLNGFFSEWLLLKTLLQSAISETSPIYVMGAMMCVAIIGIVAALIATAYIKTVGSIFLAHPRSHLTQDVKEPAVSMSMGMAISVLFCILLSLCFVPLQSFFIQTSSGLLRNEFINYHFTFNPHYFIMTLILASLLIFFVLKLLSPAPRTYETWTCGITPDSSMEYTGTAFVEPVKIILKHIFFPDRKIEHQYQVAKYFSKKISYHDSIKLVIDQYLYQPISEGSLKLARKIRGIQTGSIQSYLSYIFITLIILLIWAR